MGEGLKFLLYFIIGGSILTLVTYFGSKDKGILAAFIAFFPMVSLMSILTIYSEAGGLPVLDYVKGLLILTPLWIIFLICIIYTTKTRVIYCPNYRIGYLYYFISYINQLYQLLNVIFQGFIY
jgi:hypothetical protein